MNGFLNVFYKGGGKRDVFQFALAGNSVKFRDGPAAVSEDEHRMMSLYNECFEMKPYGKARLVE